MPDATLLMGLGFSGFRSFGTQELQRVGPMTKVHLLAGPNNAGKSNVLLLARHGLATLREGTAWEPNPTLDVPQAAGDAEQSGPRIAVLRHVSEAEFLAVVGEPNAGYAGPLRDTLTRPSFTAGGADGFWFEFELTRDSMSGQARGWTASQRQVDEIGDDELVSQLSGILTGNRGGGAGQDARRVLDTVVRDLMVTDKIPPVATIGAFRQIVPGSTEGVIDEEHHGPGLIQRLAALQNPTAERPEDQARFAEINDFVRTLFDDPAAAVEVPHDRATLLVHHGGRRLPLENYGTGLHEVIILAVAATVLSGNLVCIEEPEIHLHPTLQRKLLRYLTEHTDNQYLVATHSAHMLDAARASITAVRLDNGNSYLSPALEPKEIADLSAGLGARASDLVQANAVVWVEGPSDRTLIRGWIYRVDPSLVEGIHYSIMFYGGSLLRHLSANDQLVSEFIGLPRINRNFSVVIDSDRSKKGAQLNATKRRVRREINDLAGKGSAWVTRGYTIENYVPPELLGEALKVVHPKASLLWSGDPYTNPFATDQVKDAPPTIDKVRIASEVIERWPANGDWPHDLRGQVNRMVAMIRGANDLEAGP